MRIEFIYNDDGLRVGYKLISETEDDYVKMGAVRDMIFFGFDEKEMVYDGRESTPDDKRIQALKWCTKEHSEQKRKRFHI